MDTFVVRIWKPPPETVESHELRGVVEHLGSGESRAFRDDTELLAFLRCGPREREHALGRGEGGAR